MQVAQHHRLGSLPAGPCSRPPLHPGRAWRQAPRSRRRVSTADAPTISQDVIPVVDQVLNLVKDTDGGLAMPEGIKVQVDQLLDQLEVQGRSQQPRPNLNPLLWGNYNVAYTSTRRSPDQGQPAGGRFRNRIGRSLFQTEGLFQSCIAPDICSNKVAFRLFGVIRGAVALRGKITPVGDNDDTVRVRFEPTLLSFGSLHLRLGLPSEVQLTTTYLDERIRLGKGSRGSLFVFTRGGEADQAGMDEVGTQTTPAHVGALASATYIAAMLGSLALLLAPTHPALKGLSLLVLVLGALVGAVLRNGGIVPEDRAAKNVQEQAMKPIVG